jgi:hypothetical protein
MATAFRITYPVASADPSSQQALVHRFRNLAQELNYALSSRAQGRVVDTDNITSTMVVVVAAKAHIGAVSSTIERLLQSHHFKGVATVVRTRA